jgi:hypothetical protein
VLAGRGFAGIGIVLGLLAMALSLTSGGGVSYADDGTVIAFLIITLSLASHFPAEIGADAQGAAFGSAAFGFFLFTPALFAFDNLGSLGSAGWLGLCTVLIPIGFFMVERAEAGHAPAAALPSRHVTKDATLLVTTIGLALIVVSVWLDASDSGPSYWNASKTLAILILLLAVANALLAMRAPATSNLALLTAATTFGLVEVGFVQTAFENFGSLGAGGWLQAFGGVFLLVSVLAARANARAGALAPAPAH